MKSLWITLVTLVVSHAVEAATISGKVSDILTEAGIPAAKVSVYDQQQQPGPDAKPLFETNTKANGTYTVEVPLGIYELRYEKLQYQERPEIVRDVLVLSEPVTNDVELLMESGGRTYYAKIPEKLRQNPIKFLKDITRIFTAMNATDRKIIGSVVYPDKK